MIMQENELQQDESSQELETKPSFVYLLVSSDNKATYVGATVDLDHRLRQHNKEIKGGAHATSIKVGQGNTWRRACYVSGFPNWQAALQFEWRWKQIGRKRLKTDGKLKPLERRMLALNELLSFQQSTSKAIPYSQWNTPPEIHMEHMEPMK
jgi:structure-specific endonuclease subunit SLX1